MNDYEVIGFCNKAGVNPSSGAIALVKVAHWIERIVNQVRKWFD